MLEWISKTNYISTLFDAHVLGIVPHQPGRVASEAILGAVHHQLGLSAVGEAGDAILLLPFPVHGHRGIGLSWSLFILLCYLF